MFVLSSETLIKDLFGTELMKERQKEQYEQLCRFWVCCWAIWREVFLERGQVSAWLVNVDDALQDWGEYHRQPKH